MHGGPLVGIVNILEQIVCMILMIKLDKGATPPSRRST